MKFEEILYAFLCEIKRLSLNQLSVTEIKVTPFFFDIILESIHREYKFSHSAVTFLPDEGRLFLHGVAIVPDDGYSSFVIPDPETPSVFGPYVQLSFKNDEGEKW